VEVIAATASPCQPTLDRRALYRPFNLSVILSWDGSGGPWFIPGAGVFVTRVFD
jgi:hypothetical protein